MDMNKFLVAGLVSGTTLLLGSFLVGKPVSADTGNTTQTQVQTTTNKSIGVSTDEAPTNVSSIADIPSGTVSKQSFNTTYLSFANQYKNLSDKSNDTINGYGVDGMYFAPTSSNNQVVLGIYNEDGTLAKTANPFGYHVDTNALTNLNDDSNYIIVLNVATDISQTNGKYTGKGALAFDKGNGTEIKSFLQNLKNTTNYNFYMNRQNFFSDSTVLAKNYAVNINNIDTKAPTAKSLVNFYNKFCGENLNSQNNLVN